MQGGINQAEYIDPNRQVLCIKVQNKYSQMKEHYANI